MHTLRSIVLPGFCSHPVAWTPESKGSNQKDQKRREIFCLCFVAERRESALAVGPLLDAGRRVSAAAPGQGYSPRAPRSARAAGFLLASPPLGRPARAPWPGRPSSELLRRRPGAAGLEARSRAALLSPALGAPGELPACRARGLPGWLAAARGRGPGARGQPAPRPPGRAALLLAGPPRAPAAALAAPPEAAGLLRVLSWQWLPLP